MQDSLIQRYSRYLIFFILAVLPLERIPSVSLGPHDTTIRLSQVAALALIVINVPKMWQRHRDLLERPWRWLVLFWLACIGASLVALEPKRALEVSAFTVFVGLMAWAISLRFEPHRLMVYGKILLFSALAVCLFGLYQFFGDLVGLPHAWTGLREQYTKKVFGFPRIQATALEPLYLANYLLIPLSVFGAWYIFMKRRVRWALLVILPILWLTLSRGGFAAAATVIVILGGLGMFYGHFRRVAELAALTVLSVGLAYGLIWGGSLAYTLWDRSQQGTKHQADANLERFSRQSTNVDSGASATGRTIARRLALKAFGERPWLGIGPGNFGRYAHEQDRKRFKNTDSIANNEPLEVLAETGLAGFLTLGFFMFSLASSALRTGFRPDRTPAQVALIGLGVALIGFAAQYQTFSTLYITHIWVVIGLLAALATTRDRVDKRTQEVS